MQRQVIELGDKINAVSMLTAGVAMVVVIAHKQARMAVIVERT